ncbi:hypothetical protein D3C71_1692880 [compost metagenome]
MDEPENPLGSDGQFGNADAQVRQSIGDGVGNRGRCPDRSAFPHATKATQRVRRDGWQVNQFH